MAILVHDKTDINTKYLSTFLYVKDPLNWDSYFGAMNYIGEATVSDIEHGKNIHCNGYKLIDLRAYVGTNNSNSDDGRVLAYLNNILNKINASSMYYLIKGYDYEDLSFKHLIIFNATSDITFESGNQRKEAGDKVVLVRDPSYSGSLTLKAGYLYLAFIDTSSGNYDLEYYSMQPRIRS